MHTAMPLTSISASIGGGALALRRRPSRSRSTARSAHSQQANQVSLRHSRISKLAAEETNGAELAAIGVPGKRGLITTTSLATSQ